MVRRVCRLVRTDAWLSVADGAESTDYLKLTRPLLRRRFYGASLSFALPWLAFGLSERIAGNVFEDAEAMGQTALKSRRCACGPGRLAAVPLSTTMAIAVIFQVNVGTLAAARLGLLLPLFTKYYRYQMQSPTKLEWQLAKRPHPIRPTVEN